MKPRALLALLTIAGAAHAALGPRYGDELTIAVSSFGNSEPRAAPTAAERLALGLVHETLVRLDRDGAPSPSLAAGWSQAAQGREWTLRLDPRARFHDDAPVTPASVASSLRRFLRADSSAAEAFALAISGGAEFRSGASAELPGLQLGDGAAVTLRLTHRSSGLLSALASPAAAVRSDDGRGAGAFAPVLEVPGRRLLARAHLGHVRGRPFLERVLLVARTRDPLADAGLAPAGAPALQATLLLALDPAKPPFDAAGVRAAVDAAFDRADLARRVSGGAPRLAFSELPAQASELKAARVPQRAFALAVDDEVPPPASQRIVALLASLGLRADVRVLPGAEIRRSDAAARLLLFLPEVDDSGLVLREAMRLARLSGLGAALEAADAEPDDVRRRALLREVEQKLLAERTLLPLVTLPIGVIAPEGTHGLRFDAAGRLVVEDAWREPR